MPENTVEKVTAMLEARKVGLEEELSRVSKALDGLKPKPPRKKPGPKPGSKRKKPAAKK